MEQKITKKTKMGLAISLILILSGCAGLQTGKAYPKAWNFVPLAIPLQATQQQELKLAQIEQILTKKDLTKNELAQLYLERGLVNDSLGLRDLARLDYNRSLSVLPNQPQIFNVLGIHYTQIGMYDAAYEAFDSTLELDEKHQYAQRNRGIALYYGGRLSLAHQDLSEHFSQNTNDVYPALWLYWVEREKNGFDYANAQLEKRFQDSDKKAWAWQIAQYYLGQLTEETLLANLVSGSKNNLELAAKLCEAYFYLAKDYQNRGDYLNAVALYKLSMSGNVYEFVEHRYSLLELTRIADQKRI